ncbi:hypothetical protein [Ciceribacter sp. RN22]|uniref:hypothetical protein n=1 Tax=Ciceribacter sp. RN22 TaxID=2954932 RepID=UPI002093E582|nr:hypothetical protein [Ciceribacter sp. RN22]MCO6179526.1 hypothetical protein [Ciceribacter sp. RN22]
MKELLDLLTDQDFRHQLGRRFEALVEEAFQIVRWCIIVGFAQFLAIRHPGQVFGPLYWVLAALLFGYLTSRFLLRPEIRLFPHNPTRRQRVVQSLANFLVCVVLFLAVLWLIAAVVDAMAVYRLSQ